MFEPWAAPSDPEGAFVEICGVGVPVEPYFSDPTLASGWPAVQVDGEHGCCVVWSDELQKYFVQLLDGLYVLIPRANLRPWTPPPPEEGGFDLAWPPAYPGEGASPEAWGHFAAELAELLAQKGWCLINLPVDEASRAMALEQARTLPDLASPKAELLTDLLGREGAGKTSVLEPSGAAAEEVWALADFDAQLTDLARALAPLTSERLGFRSRGRRKGMVWVPFSTAAEARRLQPASLTREDVDAGVLDAHLEFIRSRRLCLMAWIQNEGGEFVLYPRKASMPDADPIVLPLSAGKLLVYRCDCISHGCRPATRSAVSLTTWILDDELDRRRLAGGTFDGSEVARAEAMGILSGPAMPTGFRTHIMAIHSHSPCNVHDIDEFAAIFRAGADGYERIPALRFDVDIYCTMPGEEKSLFKSYVSHSAMLETSELINFDNEFFGITSEEAKLVAPGQRAVLQDGYTTLHKAGFTRSSLRGRCMGAYVGDTGSEFNSLEKLASDQLGANLAGAAGMPSALRFAQPGTMSVVTAHRLSHTFGMTGGAASVDTACSASLVGLAVAVQAFRRPVEEQLRPCAEKYNEDAICMGISCLLSPFAFIGLCGPSMLSPKGRCLTFDVGANGYARGDGFAGAYVKPSDSEEDNLQQVACLLGAAVNQDGRSATLTAPNGVAQQAVIRASMREAGVQANQITIGECHGTGTALGDPIEVGAYRSVMEPREIPVLATSSKSNIGHLECCAGLTGLLKCCVMVATSCASPNLHLHSLNPHLDIHGFPAYFETEHADTGLNSNFAGVSSFGFSGTNARADIWGRCDWGAHRAKTMDGLKLQVQVQCPVTLGLMDMLTGENIVPGRPAESKASVLREEGAPYDISCAAYDGGFRCRLVDETKDLGEDEDLDPFVGVFITGTWTAYSAMEEMTRIGGGWYVATVALGDTRCEHFRLCLNEARELEIYPTVDHAASTIWIEGPDAQADNRSWCIDGRDMEVAAGTLFEVRFKWHRDRKRIEWRQCSQPASPSWTAPRYEHGYSLIGTSTSERFSEMLPDGEGGWEGTLRIGATCEEEFQIARDHDWQQIIYPAEPHTVRTAIPVRGPDELHGGKCWRVLGPAGDVVTVRLLLRDGHVSVAIASSRGTKRWRSREGLERHTLAVLGSWTDDVPVEMAPDPEQGVFRAFGKIREEGYDASTGLYVEAFQLLIDGDLGLPIYPQIDGADSGESIALGPGGDSRQRSWAVSSIAPGARFEICYNPRSVDRRRVVTWRWMEQLCLR